MGRAMDQDDLKPQLEQMARQLIHISPLLHQLYQDQVELVAMMNAQNLFKFDAESHQIRLCNGLCYIQLQTTAALSFQFPPSPFQSIKIATFHAQAAPSELLEEFFLQDIHFCTGDLKPQHSLYLRNKATQLRQLILQQVFQTLDGRTRVAQFFEHMDDAQAEIIDQWMQKQGIYQTLIMHDFVQSHEPKQQALPTKMMALFEQLFTLNNFTEPTLLPLQMLMESLDEFCFAAPQFLDPAIYRIISLTYEERFSLHELNEHVDDVMLLLNHAQERPNLLSFVRLMQRNVWCQQDVLSQRNFLQPTAIWQKKVGKQPLLDNKRAVRWLFKQSAEVLDWLSRNIQHSSVRVAVMALSYVDTRHTHPSIILATLQYFQFIAAKIFIQSCYDSAIKQDWFNVENQHQFVLQEKRQYLDDHRITISPSILYLDEWLLLMCQMVAMDDVAVKKVCQPLSRLMQAYLQHLNRCTAHLPNELIAYLHPEHQENRDFFNVLHRHHIQLNEFRQLFYLKHHNLRVTVFDSYVRDYLSAVMTQKTDVPKNVSWQGLFHQARHWHDQMHQQEILSKLKKNFASVVWTARTRTQNLIFENWFFEELKTIDRIIGESRRFQHCLAASYSERIIREEYVAFHMYHHAQSQFMTLGCVIQNQTLVFDQLEYANNAKADEITVNIAQRFVRWFNQLEHR